MPVSADTAQIVTLINKKICSVMMFASASVTEHIIWVKNKPYDGVCKVCVYSLTWRGRKHLVNAIKHYHIQGEKCQNYCIVGNRSWL
jgi:succinate dehydrogenase/fumarate reductase cytochrome b subunit